MGRYLDALRDDERRLALDTYYKALQRLIELDIPVPGKDAYDEAIRERDEARAALESVITGS